MLATSGMVMATCLKLESVKLSPRPLNLHDPRQLLCPPPILHGVAQDVLQRADPLFSGIPVPYQRAVPHKRPEEVSH